MTESNGQILQDLSDSWRAALAPVSTEPPDSSLAEQHEPSDASATTADPGPTEGKATRKPRTAAADK